MLWPEAHWTVRAAGGVDDLSRFEVLEQGRPRATVQWGLIGAHNMENALAAIAAARHAGVAVERCNRGSAVVHGRGPTHAASRRGQRRARL